MRSVAALLFAPVVLALVAPVGLQSAQLKNKKPPQNNAPKTTQPARNKHHHEAHGVVTHVKRDRDGDDGSFVIHTHHHARGKNAHHRTFQVLPTTTFFIAHDGKRTRASFKRLHKGEHVIVHPLDDRPGIARSVTIVGHHKKSAQTVRGTVASFKRDEDNDNGSVTLHIGEAGEGKQRTKVVQVLPITSFVSVRDGKREPASFGDVRDGQHLLIHAIEDRPELAHTVAILLDAR
jgi:hypothetical protein